MRKLNKSDLIKLITNDIEHLDSLPPNTKTVIDGGALLHQGKWQKSSTYEEVFNQYCYYLENKYGVCKVIFDGYESITTKNQEHIRRNFVVQSCSVHICADNQVPFTQDRFLSNKELV